MDNYKYQFEYSIYDKKQLVKILSHNRAVNENWELFCQYAKLNKAGLLELLDRLFLRGVKIYRPIWD